jgi:hypothetical protein
MTSRGTKRAARRQRRGGPAPELVAVILVGVLYGAVLIVGLPAVAIPDLGIGAAPPTEAPVATRSPAPGAATPDPLRADVDAIREVNERLTESRDSLQGLLTNPAQRSAEIATVLRRVTSTLPFGLDRAGRLALDPRTQAVGSQLELIYANAAATANGALEFAISSDAAYRDAAEQIVELFAELPNIDAALAAAIGTGSLPSPEPSAAASASTSPEPSASASAVPAPSASPVASGVPVPTRSPDELLRNPGFDAGLAPWALVLRGPEDRATTRPDQPIAASGTSSLRVDITSISATPDGVRVGQEGLGINASTRYLVSVVVRSSVERAIRLRVVGPNQELYRVFGATAGPTATLVTFDFIAIMSDASVGLWIDIAGPMSGTVWLDEASFAPTAPG